MADPVRVSLVHLGCARNQVDSEVMLGRLADEGLTVCGDLRDAQVAIVNTCSFIGPAREESFRAIEQVLEKKHRGQLKAVLVAGCLAEQFRGEIEQRVPDVDAILPLSDYSQISQIATKAVAGESVKSLPGGRPKSAESDQVRFLTTPGSYAYLRISEGCDHTCSFCIIPTIRGGMRSKPIESLVNEAKNLASLGVKELVIVAEDSTWYGRDIYGEQRLPELCEALSKVEGIRWIRVLYAYPNLFPWNLTKVMRENPKVVPYLDIPIQHIADPMLRAMRRAGSGDQVRAILNRLREDVPGIAIRSTVIVGFPGESDQDFDTLLKFLGEFKFDRLGAFQYSDEPKSDAFRLGDKVDPKVASERFEQVMQLQGEILTKKNKSLVGQTLPVLIDLEDQKNLYWGRTLRDAPETDCTIQVKRKNLKAGDLIQVKVVGTTQDGYDLTAV